MDDFFDDLLDPTTPMGLAVAATVLDDDERCTCSCECPREPAWPDDRCAECLEDRHWGESGE